MFETLSIFHFEISGIDVNDKQPENKPDILVALFVFHFEISGNDSNDEQLSNEL